MDSYQLIATKDGKTGLVQITANSEAHAADQLQGQGYTDVHVPTYAAGIPMQPVVSSQLDSVGHDPATNTLAVRFKAKAGPGSLYVYDNVTAEQFATAQGAESFNSWFIANVKKKADEHPYRKVAETA